MPERVLVTGATGFVGSHIIDALQADESIHVIAACRDPGRLPAGFDGPVRQGDLRDGAYLQRMVGEVDVICHAAAWTSLWSHREASASNFLQPTLQLIDTAKGAGVKRFIFPSSTSVGATTRSSDAHTRGRPPGFWPHLGNVIKIEDRLRELGDGIFQTMSLRLGIFTGRRYSLGMLPILLPRLKTHLVPWVSGGRTQLPLIDGADIGQAFHKAVLAQELPSYAAFNIVGPEQPSVRELIGFIHKEFGYPKPHFSVPFALAYPFAWLMEALNPIMPWEPLVTRSIIHLLENTGADNAQAEAGLGYRPNVPWQDSVRAQINEIHRRQHKPMSMAVADTGSRS